MSDTPPTLHGCLDSIYHVITQLTGLRDTLEGTDADASGRLSGLIVELYDLTMTASTLVGMPSIDELDEKRVMDDNAQDWLP